MLKALAAQSGLTHVIHTRPLVLPRMRIVQVHNFYRSSAPSGEDEVVRTERALLRDHGVEVIEFERHHDKLGNGIGGALRASFSNIWSESARRDLSGVLRRHRPDVVHFHNTFPQISAAGYSACVDAGIPAVQTLHNFRLFCANGLLNRENQPCESCVTRGPLSPAARKCRCWRKSSWPRTFTALPTTVACTRGTSWHLSLSSSRRRSSGNGRPRRMSSSHTTAPPRPLPCWTTDPSAIEGPQTALSRPAATGAPLARGVAVVTVPVIGAPLAVGSGW